MRWKTGNHYKEGDTRTRKRFAWVPEECEDGITVWLEYYHQTETLIWGMVLVGDGSWVRGWEWVPTKKVAK